MTQTFETGQRVRDRNQLHNRGLGTVVQVNRGDNEMGETALSYTVRWDSGKEDALVYATELEPAVPATPAR